MKQTSMFTSEDLPLFSQTPVPAIIPLVGTDSPYQPEPESNLEQLQLVADEIDRGPDYQELYAEYFRLDQLAADLFLAANRICPKPNQDATPQWYKLLGEANAMTDRKNAAYKAYIDAYKAERNH